MPPVSVAAYRSWQAGGLQRPARAGGPGRQQRAQGSGQEPECGSDSPARFQLARGVEGVRLGCHLQLSTRSALNTERHQVRNQRQPSEKQQKHQTPPFASCLFSSG